MKTSSMIVAIVMTSVVIILAGALLVPVVNDTSTDTTYSNTLDGSTTYVNKLVDPTDASITINIDPTNSLININGKDYPIDSSHAAIIMMDGGYFRFWDNSGFKTGYAGGGVTSQATNSDSGTITIQNGTVEYTAGEVSLTWQSSDFVLLPDANGTYYVRYAAQGPQYINDIDDIYVASIANNKLVWGNGDTLTDGTNTYEAVLTSDVVQTSGTVDVYTLPTMKSYRMMDSGSGYYPAFVCVPVEVDGTTEGWENISNLLSVIPVMVVVSAVIAAVAIFLKRE